MIRNAFRDDIPSLVSLARDYHRDKGLPFPFDSARVSVTFATAIANDDWLCLVGDRAVLLAVSFDSPLGAGRLAQEIMFRSALPKVSSMMLDAYEAWARRKGCVQCSLACLENPETFARLWRRRDYALAETFFAKRL